MVDFEGRVIFVNIILGNDFGLIFVPADSNIVRVNL